MSPGHPTALEAARRYVVAVLEAAGVRLAVPAPDAPGRWRSDLSGRVELLDPSGRQVVAVVALDPPGPALVTLPGVTSTDGRPLVAEVAARSDPAPAGARHPPPTHCNADRAPGVGGPSDPTFPEFPGFHSE